MTIIWLALAGGLGALARYEFGGWIQTRTESAQPLGTLAVNTTGSILLGFVHQIPLTGPFADVVIAGFLGGFTTYSTWMAETTNLGMQGGRSGIRLAAINLAGMLAGGLLGISLGSWLGDLIK